MSQLQTNGTVSSEMLVKALIRQFVSTSNLRGKKSLFFLKNREVSCFSVD